MVVCAYVWHIALKHTDIHTNQETNGNVFIIFRVITFICTFLLEFHDTRYRHRDVFLVSIIREVSSIRFPFIMRVQHEEKKEKKKEKSVYKSLGTTQVWVDTRAYWCVVLRGLFLDVLPAFSNVCFLAFIDTRKTSLCLYLVSWNSSRNVYIKVITRNVILHMGWEV